MSLEKYGIKIVMKKIKILFALASLLVLPVFAWAQPFAPTLVRVDGVAYLDLKVFSAAHNLNYSWDPLTKNASIDSSGKKYRFHVGSEYFLDQGRLAAMDQKTRVWQGKVLVGDGLRAILAPATPTTSSPTIPKPQAPIQHRIRRIVVDAGHGGKDPGAQSSSGLNEKRLVLDVARKIRDELRRQGIEVIMTRDSDVFIPLPGRADVANRSGADLFVSIHANASKTRTLRGFEIYTLSEATDDFALALERSENSVIRFESDQPKILNNQLKTILWDLKETANRAESLKLAQFVSSAVDKRVEISAKRVKSANFYVLKWTECPSVLVEIGYITNRYDLRRLQNPTYKREMAQAIALGILGYKQQFEATNGYTQ